MLEPVDEHLAAAEPGEPVVVARRVSATGRREHRDLGPELVDLGLQLRVSRRSSSRSLRISASMPSSPGRPEKVIDSGSQPVRSSDPSPKMNPPIRSCSRADRPILPLDRHPEVTVTWRVVRAVPSISWVSATGSTRAGAHDHRLGRHDHRVGVAGASRGDLRRPRWPPGHRNLTDLRSADVSASRDDDGPRSSPCTSPHLDKVRGHEERRHRRRQLRPRPVSSRTSRSRPGLSLIVFNDLLNACTWLGIDKTVAQSDGHRAAQPDPPGLHRSASSQPPQDHSAFASNRSEVLFRGRIEDGEAGSWCRRKRICRDVTARRGPARRSSAR